MNKHLLAVVLMGALLPAQARPGEVSTLNYLVNRTGVQIVYPADNSVPRDKAGRSPFARVCPAGPQQANGSWALMEPEEGWWIGAAVRQASMGSSRFPVFVCDPERATPLERMTIIDTGRRIGDKREGQPVSPYREASIDCKKADCSVFLTVDKHERVRHCYAVFDASLTYGMTALVKALPVGQGGGFDLELAGFTGFHGAMPDTPAIELQAADDDYASLCSPA